MGFAVFCVYMSAYRMFDLSVYYMFLSVLILLVGSFDL